MVESVSTQTCCADSSVSPAPIANVEVQIDAMCFGAEAENIGDKLCTDKLNQGDNPTAELKRESIDSEGSKGKKRRKLIKSCVFCRKRKLKCDRKRPRCTGCEMRKLPECIYTDDYNFDVTYDELFSDSPNIQLLREINSLKKQLKEQKALAMNDLGQTTVVTSDEQVSSDKGVNPLFDLTLIQAKKGRTTFYGPTSMRAQPLQAFSKFSKSINELWKFCKEERIVMKNRFHSSKLYEMQSIESPWSLDKLVSDLPKYSQLCGLIMVILKYKNQRFFRVFNAGTLMEYLTNCFKIRDDKIIGLLPYPKFNYYPIGIVLSIYASFLEEVPPSFVSFFVMLSGQTTAKAFFLERVQFLLLQYFWKASRDHTGGDNSHLSTLFDNIATSALSIGLPTLVAKGTGDIQVLRFVWYWVLYTDVRISLDMGRPLIIDDGSFDVDSLLITEDTDDDFTLYFKKFIYHGRSAIKEIYVRDRVPDLWLHVRKLMALLDEMCPNLREFIKSRGESDTEVDIGKILITFTLLSFITNFMTLARIKLNDYSVENCNLFLKYTLLTQGLSFSTLFSCYRLDVEQNPEWLTDLDKFPPNLGIAVSIVPTYLTRHLVEAYTFLLDLITRGVVAGPTIPYELYDDPPMDKVFPIRTIFDILVSSWDINREARFSGLYQLMKKRRSFFQILLYESAARIVFQKFIKTCKGKFENGSCPGNMCDSSIAVQKPAVQSEKIPNFSVQEQPDLFEFLNNDFLSQYGQSLDGFFDFQDDFGGFLNPSQ